MTEPVRSTPTASGIIERLDAAYRAAADPQRASAMAAYMRDQFVFLGIAKPRRAQLDRDIVGRERLDAQAALSTAAWCWAQPEREFAYFACERLRSVAGTVAAEELSTVRTFIETRPWWDTVDTLAAHVVGPMAATHPAVSEQLDQWIDDHNIWIARTAILHQLTYGEATDADRLFRYCLRRADHPDFFIRKASGWALRQYARTDPERVRTFLVEHRTELAPLSVREAAKHLGPLDAR